MFGWFTWYYTHKELQPLFLIGFVVAGGGIYSYYIHQENKSDKEMKIVTKKLSFMHTKRFNTFFKRWVQFRVCSIPRLPFGLIVYFEVQGYFIKQEKKSRGFVKNKKIP